MTDLAEEELRMELRGFVRRGDPLWSRCLDMRPRKALAMVLGLAKDALEIEDRFKQFKDDDHPLGKRLRAMTPGEALLYLLLWSKDCGLSTSTESGLQNLPTKSAVAVQLSDKSGGLAAVHFDADEMDATSALPGQTN